MWIDEGGSKMVLQDAQSFRFVVHGGQDRGQRGGWILPRIARLNIDNQNDAFFRRCGRENTHILPLKKTR